MKSSIKEYRILWRRLAYEIEYRLLALHTLNYRQLTK